MKQPYYGIYFPKAGEPQINPGDEIHTTCPNGYLWLIEVAKVDAFPGTDDQPAATLRLQGTATLISSGEGGIE